MMKKLLVMLTMLAAISNAAILELSVDGVTNGAGTDQAITLDVDATAMIDVYCSSGANADTWYISVEGPGSLGGLGTIYSPPAPDSTTSYYTYEGQLYIYFTPSGSPTPTPAVGKWWDELFTCDGEGTVTINLWDENASYVEDTITVTQVPEPMTIALLGLAGLFLRRRK